MRPTPIRKPFYLAISISVFACLSSNSVSAQSLDTSSEDLAFREAQMLGLFYEGESSLATRTPQPVKSSPANITIFTGEELKLMGARDLRDALNLVPGMYVQIVQGGYPTVAMRGMRTDGSEHILFLVNGHAVNNSILGGANLFFADMSVEHIKYVEVMRGTGSSLYGGNAFSGVVNIVTNKAEDINGVAITAREGLHDDRRYNIEAGKAYENASFWANLNYHSTNGANIRVPVDALNSNPLSPNARISHAPADISDWVERTELSFGSSWHKFTFQGQFIDHKDGGFFNPSGSLTPNTTMARKYTWGELSYKDSLFSGLLDTTARLSYNFLDMASDIELQPPGYRNAAGMLYPNGMRGIQLAKVGELNAGLQGDMHWRDHLLTVGFETQDVNMDTRYKANYNPRPLPYLMDVTSGFNWLSPADRFVYSIYAQDQWRFAEKWSLTAGVRNDDYDDTGESLSPNLALVYEVNNKMRLKAIYGKAFRPPTLREMYKLAQGGPRIGNKDLSSEDIETYQAGVEWQPTKALDVSLYGYNSNISRMIQEVWHAEQRAYIYENTSNGHVKGVDLGLKYRFLNAWPNTRLFFNASYTWAEDAFGRELPAVPQWLCSGGLDWGFAPNLHLHTDTYYVGPSLTQADDPRKRFKGYWVSNAAITARNALGLMKGLDITASVFNLFDRRYAYPDLSGSFPGNKTAAGITALLTATYRF
jgi:iron complex outermembrane receptor protein